jgi:hypothetical protein
MGKILKYLKYSGIWIGIVVNPIHWRFSLTNESILENYIFDNCVYFGPVWIRVIIDDGRW